MAQLRDQKFRVDVDDRGERMNLKIRQAQMQKIPYMLVVGHCPLRYGKCLGVAIMAKPPYKPGQTAPDSGQYPLKGPMGGDQGREVTVVEGEPFPPTPKPGMGYG